MRIRRALRSIRPDVIHAYGYPCDVYASILSLPRRGRIVVTSRRGNQDMAMVHWLYRVTNPIVDRVVCVSEAAERFAVETERLSRRRSKVIPNGIDVDAFGRSSRSPDSRPIRTIGTLGRLREVKGPDLLLDAFRRLGRRDLDLKIGGPADSAWGVVFRDRHQAEEGVSFPDPSSTFLLLGSLDCCPPEPSDVERPARGDGRRLPIVATDVGSNAQVLDGGRRGFVKPGRAIAERGSRAFIDEPARRGRDAAPAAVWRRSAARHDGAPLRGLLRRSAAERGTERRRLESGELPADDWLRLSRANVRQSPSTAARADGHESEVPSWRARGAGSAEVARCQSRPSLTA
jgi:glycosyltransferase involved in cell wall biosynthesis